MKRSVAEKLWRVAAMSFAVTGTCITVAAQDCRATYASEEYQFLYDGCHVAVSKKKPSDFEVAVLKLKGGTEKTILTIYVGGAPNIARLRKDRAAVVKTKINGLTAELVQTETNEVFGSETLVTLPVNKYGRMLYIHLQAEGLNRAEKAMADQVVSSIRLP